MQEPAFSLRPHPCLPRLAILPVRPRGGTSSRSPPAPLPMTTPPALTTNPETNRSTRPEDKVGFWEKSALGAGYLAKFYGDNGVKSMAVPFYQMVLRVDPGILGLIL